MANNNLFVAVQADPRPIEAHAKICGAPLFEVNARANFSDDFTAVSSVQFSIRAVNECDIGGFLMNCSKSLADEVTREQAFSQLCHFLHVPMEPFTLSKLPRESEQRTLRVAIRICFGSCCQGLKNQLRSNPSQALEVGMQQESGLIAIKDGRAMLAHFQFKISKQRDQKSFDIVVTVRYWKRESAVSLVSEMYRFPDGNTPDSHRPVNLKWSPADAICRSTESDPIDAAASDGK